MTLPPDEIVLSSLMVDRGDVSFGLVGATEIPDAARIYVQSFPHIAGQLFHDLAKAEIFYQDLFELMRLAYPETFFSAKNEGKLVGFLILVVPDKRLMPVIFQSGFFIRAAWRLLSNRYGFSLPLLKQIVKKLFFSPRLGIKEVDLPGIPHIYVIVVEDSITGKGIGTVLLKLAKDACIKKYGQMWLEVKRENSNAIAFYQRHGFRFLFSDEQQHIMVWQNSTV